MSRNIQYSLKFIAKPNPDAPLYGGDKKPAVKLGELKTFGVKEVVGYRVLIDGDDFHTIYHTERTLQNVKRGTQAVTKPNQWRVESLQERTIAFADGTQVELLRNRQIKINKDKKAPLIYDLSFNEKDGKVVLNTTPEVNYYLATYAFTENSGLGTIEFNPPNKVAAQTQKEVVQVLYPQNADLTLEAQLPRSIGLARAEDGSQESKEERKVFLNLKVNGRTERIPFGKDNTLHLTTYRIAPPPVAPRPQKAQAALKLPTIVEKDEPPIVASKAAHKKLRLTSSLPALATAQNRKIKHWYLHVLPSISEVANSSFVKKSSEQK